MRMETRESEVTYPVGRRGLTKIAQDRASSKPHPNRPCCSVIPRRDVAL